MKTLITADFHIGVRGDSELYQSIFIKWVTDFLVPTINSKGIENICILGDFYDNRSAVNIKSDNLGIQSIQYILAETKCKIYIISGNHDCYHRTSRNVTSLKKFEEYDRVFVINNRMKFRFGTRDVTFVPWVLEEEVDVVFSDKGDILMGHFPFTGYEMVKGVTETKGYSLEKLKQNYLKVFSGHFHLRNEPYVGNPFQMSWNDAEDEKGVTILDTETLQTEFVTNTISPIYKKIYLSQIKNKTVSLDVVTNNFVKIFLDDKYNDKMVSKLQEVVLSKKPLSFSFDGLNEEEINTDVLVNDLTNPIQSLIMWLDKIELKKGVDRNILLEKVNSLYNSSLN